MRARQRRPWRQPDVVSGFLRRGRPRSPTAPVASHSPAHEPGQPEFVPAVFPFRIRRKLQAVQPSRARSEWSGPRLRSGGVHLRPRLSAVRRIESSRFAVASLLPSADRLRLNSLNFSVVSFAARRWPKKGRSVASITSCQTRAVVGLMLAPVYSSRSSSSSPQVTFAVTTSATSPRDFLPSNWSRSSTASWRLRDPDDF